MARFQKKWERIQSLKLDKLVEQLEAKVAILEFLQTSPYTIPALRNFLSTPGLTKAEKLEILKCIGYLDPDR